MSKGFTTLAYTSNGLIFEDYDASVIVGKSLPKELEVEIGTFLISVDKIFVNGDFNTHDKITVQLGNLSNNIDPEDIQEGCSYFSVSVINEIGEEQTLGIDDREFELEHLSMELQKRIHDKAEEMYQDWIKLKQD